LAGFFEAAGELIRSTASGYQLAISMASGTRRIAPQATNATASRCRWIGFLSAELGWSSKLPSERRAARSKPCMSAVTAPIPPCCASARIPRTPAKYRKSWWIWR